MKLGCVLWALPLYVGHNFREIHEAFQHASTNGVNFGKTEVSAIVSTQDWDDPPWPYVPTLSGSEDDWVLTAAPMKRPLVIFLRAILLWDLHDLRHPTYTLRSTFVVEKTYPGGSTFRHELK